MNAADILVQDEKVMDEKVETTVPAMSKDLVVEGMSPNEILAAYHGALREHSQTIREAIRIGRKACMWMLVIGLVGLCIPRGLFTRSLTFA